MSTRATIKFFEVDSTQDLNEEFGTYLYHHFDGMPSSVLNEIKETWEIAKNSRYYTDRFFGHFAKNPAINMQFFILYCYNKINKTFNLEIIPGKINMMGIYYNYNILCGGSAWDIEIERKYDSKKIKINVEEINNKTIEDIKCQLEK